MASQEDYLDQLLRNIMNGGKEQPQEDVEEPAIQSNVGKMHDIRTRTRGRAFGTPGGGADTAPSGETAGYSAMGSASGNMRGVYADGTEMPGTLPMMDDMSGLYADGTEMSGMPPMMDEDQGLYGDGAGMPPEPADMSGLYADGAGMPGMPPMMDGDQGLYGDGAGMPGMPPEQDDISGLYADGMEMPGMPPMMDGNQGLYEEGAGMLPEPADMSGLYADGAGMPGMPPEQGDISGLYADGTEVPGMPPMMDGDQGLYGDGIPGMPPELDNMPGLYADGTEVPGMSPEPADMSGLYAGGTEIPGMPSMIDEDQGLYVDRAGIPGTPPEQDDMSGLYADEAGIPGIPPEQADMSGIYADEAGIPGIPPEQDDMSSLYADGEEIPGIPSEPGDIMGLDDADAGIITSADSLKAADTATQDSDIAELLKKFEGIMDEDNETSGNPGEDVFDDDVTDDLSSMSEADIERLLAESRGLAEDSADGQEEAFEGDVVDLLEGTKDRELQEIQDLLEKSDNNEAVDDQVEAILQGAAQDYVQKPGESAAGDNTEFKETGEQITAKQQKAMEKKRLREEKAAARKAEKEAKKAEKEARKAEKKAKKGKDGSQNTAGETGASDGASVDTTSVDTAFLDSILSEAGRLDGTETASSDTGNYDAKVENIVPEDLEEPAGQKKTAESASSVNDGFGVDLNNLFGNSAEAESAMMAGSSSDLPDFASLDGDDVTGILELAGEGEEEDEESKPKKKGFFSRFLEFLTEEEEEEEENEDIKLSEENQGIIEELDKEKDQKGKKGKKKKKKAGKADAPGEGEEDGENEEGKEKKGRKKKEKKPKKEKPPKEEEPVDPRKRLSLKKILPIVLICLTLTAAIIIITFASVDYMDKKAASDAYYSGDYQTCYQNLFGKDMDENEQIMFGKSECVLRIRLWIREYEILLSKGETLEALDSLIQSVNDYPELYAYAAQWNAAGEVAQEYATILNLLYEGYGLTEDQARTIAAEEDDVEYTRQVNIIVQGGAYGSWNEPEPVEDLPLQDELPEETELPEGNFIDTNTSAQ